MADTNMSTIEGMRTVLNNLPDSDEKKNANLALQDWEASRPMLQSGYGPEVMTNLGKKAQEAVKTAMAAASTTVRT